MNILFCSTGINALGETFTSGQFAHELREEGNNVYFIAPKLGRDYLVTMSFAADDILVLPSNAGEVEKRALNSENFDFVKNFEDKINPQIIIVADWHHYSEEGISNNFTYSIHWFREDIPIVTFDHLGFAPEGVKINQQAISDFVNSGQRKPFQAKVIAPLHDRISHIIRPCPHHDNKMKVNGNVFYWGLYKDKLTKKKESRKSIEREYEINSDQKIFFNPIGIWQERVIDKAFDENDIEYDYYSETYTPLLTHYLNSLDEEVVLIIISGKRKKIETEWINNVRLIVIPPLSHEKFITHLLASDVFITDNIMSSNISKAIFANITTIFFRNTLSCEDGQFQDLKFDVSDYIKELITPLTSNGLFFKHLSFPIGFCELEAMYENNPFAECFFMSELYDEEFNLNLFKEKIFCSDTQQKILNSQNEYIKNNQYLNSAQEILNQIYTN